jgi:hypothetical protein
MKQLNMDDIQRIVGGLYIENILLREELACEQKAKADADKGDTGKRGSGNKPGPVAVS